MSILPRLAAIALLLPLSACFGDDDGDDTEATAGDDAGSTDPLQWYLTCGDPVCSGYSGPFDDVAACTSEAAGTGCASGGATCDPTDDCNALLLCTDSDPTQQPGGCPISRRRHKKQVAYLAPDDVQALGAAALDLRLARWRYTWEDGSTKEHVGFLIDDAPTSPAVMADGEHVDLYGYATMALAASQRQQAEIDALRAELAALRAELSAQRDAAP